MKYGILGPLEVVHGTETVQLGGPRDRVILAMLLLEANQVIPVERLIDAVWDDPPSTARGQVQICISNLRRRLQAVSGRDLIDTRSPGYLLNVGPDELDLRVFDARVAEARDTGGPLAAAALLRGALALWRGPALSGMDSRVVTSYVSRLNERRLAVHGECIDLELQAGKHYELVGELIELVDRHPLQEHFRAQLMMALYRSGRQAEALEGYRRASEVLMDELGINPGEELRRLHQAILEGECPIPLPPHGSAVAATIAPAAQVRSLVPSLLPAAIPDFTGRAPIVGAIRAQLGEQGQVEADGPVVRVGVIVGPGGAGKTTLAVHVAHQLAPEFPDGQLFARLRVGDRPANPADILERFLRALGVSGAAMPDGIEERAERFRDLLGGRRILVVLDDAMTEQQIAVLLPGTAKCSVIVTSRRRLTGLPSVNRVELGALSRGNAVQLLTRIVGPTRIAAEPSAADELCRLSGDLPLALRIVGARLAARPHWSVTDLLERLVDESRRLDELNHGEMGVRASISVTYEGLSADAKVLLRRLALLDSPSFASWVGAPLLETDHLRAQDALEELTEAYLIDTEPGPVAGQLRYRFHDITRPFARERFVEEGPEQRRAALERWFGALLALAGEAHRREYSDDVLAPNSGASRWPLPAPLVDRLLADPLAWFEQERATIVAAVAQAAASGMVEHAWDLALTAVTLFESRSYLNDWRQTHEVALNAACRAGDVRGEAAMRYSLGSLHMFAQQSAPAARQFTRSYALFEELGDRLGMAQVLRNSAYLDRVNGDLASARDRWGRALEAFQLLGDRIAEAHVLHNLAQIHLDYGEQDAAYELLVRAGQICEEVGNRRVGAQVRHRLGELLLRRGDLEGAGVAYRGVLDSVRAAGDQIGECYAILGLAAVDHRRGDLASAARRLARAQALAVAAGDRMAESRVAHALADVALDAGELGSAAEHADRAVRIFGEIGAALLGASAMALRGRIHVAAGERAAARAGWESSRAVLSGLSLRGAVTLQAQLRRDLSALGVADADRPVAPVGSDVVHAGRPAGGEEATGSGPAPRA
ncbi:BTAD domain-containing putative transcriptional regulator [Micromonospora sp. NPDC007220]|uniref:AfsR/SARP family transcriptional regulator n=1 Tax=Micromonospora sp. NPDC007220 TaxID=3154318 RepID=UPI0033D7F195